MSLTRDALLTFLEQDLGLPTADVTDSDPLFSSGLLDSFVMVDLIMFLETATEVEVDPTDVSLDNFDSIDNILQYAAGVSAA
ncbi:MAG: acyl carrier protein [Rhodobacterales bacterium]|nr:acyl carrier protein [Rhodobacterales bacterium]